MNAIPSLLEDEHNKGVPASPSDQSGSAPSPEGLGHTATVPNAVWQATLDGLYDCQAIRLGPSFGELRIARTSGELIASGPIVFSYDAVFGPDIDDVADWQAWIVEFLEGETGGRNPLAASAIEARSDATPQSGAAERESTVPKGDAR